MIHAKAAAASSGHSALQRSERCLHSLTHAGSRLAVSMLLVTIQPLSRTVTESKKLRIKPPRGDELCGRRSAVKIPRTRARGGRRPRLATIEARQKRREWHDERESLLVQRPRIPAPSRLDRSRALRRAAGRVEGPARQDRRRLQSLGVAPPESAFAGLGYDAVNLLAAAIELVGSAKQKTVPGALEATQDFAGVTGDISFAPGVHIPEKQVTIVHVQDSVQTLAAILAPQEVPAP